MNNIEDVVLFDTRDAGHGYKIGVATLNSERSLNALSIEMVELLEPQLEAWANDDTIVCVWLQGAGDKAFCAGGDIVSRSEEHTSELQSRPHLVCRLLLEKKKKKEKRMDGRNTEDLDM